MGVPQSTALVIRDQYISRVTGDYTAGFPKQAVLGFRTITPIGDVAIYKDMNQATNTAYNTHKAIYDFQHSNTEND